MGYTKERVKLDAVRVKISGINDYNEKNFAVLIDGHEKYSHTIRILKNKEPEAFIALYQNELQDIKEGKKAVKESDSDEARQNNFIAYKGTILNAIEKTISAIKEFK